MTKLTKRQQLVFNAVCRLQPCTFRELAAACRIVTPNGIMSHLRPLKKKGYVVWEPEIGISIRAVRYKQCIPILGTVK